MLKRTKLFVLTKIVFLSLAVPSFAKAQVLIQEKDFLEGWQRPMSEALPFLIAKLNAAAEATKQTSLRYKLSYEKVSNGVRLVSEFDPAGHLNLEFRIDPKLADNPFAAFEILNYLRKVSYHDGTRLTLEDGGRMQIDLFEKIGVKPTVMSRISNIHAWSEIAIDADAGQRWAQKEYFELERSAISEIPIHQVQTFRSQLPQYEAGVRNSIQRLRELAEFRGLKISPTTDILDAWNEYSRLRSEQLARGLSALEPLVVKEAKAAKVAAAKNDQRKRDFEAADERLDALILRNDREGVARLLKTYLPWNEMGLTEKGMWTTWLEAIRRPVLENSPIVYRGIIDKEPILKTRDGKVGLISTVLSRNQGSYTRRLRSLTTLRERLGRTLNSVMARHAVDPKGSPFLSFTTEAKIANAFAYDGFIVIARVDSRRLLANLSSNVKHEKEFLVPLILFPDEIIHRVPIGELLLQAPREAEKFVEDYKRTHQVPEIGDIQEGYKLFATAVVKGRQSVSCKAAF